MHDSIEKGISPKFENPINFAHVRSFGQSGCHYCYFPNSGLLIPYAGTDSVNIAEEKKTNIPSVRSAGTKFRLGPN